MDFATRCVLSGVRHAMAEVGEVLAATESITDGDADSWLDTYVALGRRCGPVRLRLRTAASGHCQQGAAEQGGGPPLKWRGRGQAGIMSDLHRGASSPHSLAADKPPPSCPLAGPAQSPA